MILLGFSVPLMNTHTCPYLSTATLWGPLLIMSPTKTTKGFSRSSHAISRRLLNSSKHPWTSPTTRTGLPLITSEVSITWHCSGRGVLYLFCRKPLIWGHTVDISQLISAAMVWWWTACAQSRAIISRHWYWAGCIGISRWYRVLLQVLLVFCSLQFGTHDVQPESKSGRFISTVHHAPQFKPH